MEQDGRHPERIDHTADRTPGPVRHPPHRSALPEPFHVVERTVDGRRVITPCGELDLATAAELEAGLAGSIDTVLDLSELSFIDSVGIRVLISAAQRAEADAWEFTVRNPQPTVLRVIELVALEPLLGLPTQNGRASQPQERATAARSDAA